MSGSLIVGERNAGVQLLRAGSTATDHDVIQINGRGAGSLIGDIKFVVATGVLLFHVFQPVFRLRVHLHKCRSGSQGKGRRRWLRRGAAARSQQQTARNGGGLGC